MARAIVLASRIALARAMTSPNRDDQSCVNTGKADTITGAENVDDTIEMGEGSNTSQRSEVSLAPEKFYFRGSGEEVSGRIEVSLQR